MTTKTRELSNSDDVIDVRDVIARVEHLEELRQPGPVDLGDDDDNEQSQDSLFAELKALECFLDEMKGNGGDEEWRGDWYPITAIRDSYFKDYAQEFAEDIGAIKLDLGWPHNCIDWDRAARELQYDYTSVEFDGVTYWVR
jgi:hypothetical protein